MRIKIPSYAKRDAQKALRERTSLPKYKQYGLTSEEAKVLKINSGVERARQIIRNTYLSEEDARRVKAFYSRFKNCKTPKCEGSIDLWGGRKWGRELQDEFED